MNGIVLFGGPSRERRVSVASAQNLARSIAAERYWFWSVEGEVVEVTAASLEEHARPFEQDFTPRGAHYWSSLDAALDDVGAAALVLALHGSPGEDGTVQRVLEARGIPFTGSGAEASRLAFHKQLTKARVAEHGIATPEGVVLTSQDEVTEQLPILLRRWGAFVLKPVADGSSFGLAFVRGEEDFEVARQAIAAGGEWIAERLVLGTELTVGIIELTNGQVEALPCSEVRVSPGRTFDYEGKYLGAGTKEVTPAQIAAEVSGASQELAMVAHRALGCRGYSRTDLIATAGGVVFLETNTLPGLSAASFIPQQLRAAGIALSAFIEDQVAIGRRRAATGR